VNPGTVTPDNFYLTSALQHRRTATPEISEGFDMEKTITLPKPNFKGEVSLEEAVSRRRSTREFSGRNITEDHLSQLLWASQGISDARGFRTAP